MFKTRWIAAIALTVGFSFTVMSAAAATYDESVSGDLPNDATAPTPLTLSLGTNSILGTVGSWAGTDNLDAIALTVPAGMELTSFTNSVYSGSANQDFIGFQSGTSFVGSPLVISNYVGLAHFGTSARNAGVGSPPGSPTSTVGLDLLPVMNTAGLAVGASGFTSPLGPGTYTFVIGVESAELEAFPTYQFDVTVVPELSALWLAAIGAALLSAFAVIINRKRRLFASPKSPRLDPVETKIVIRGKSI